MNAIIKIPLSLSDDNVPYIVRPIRAINTKGLRILLEELCDELVHDEAEDFEVISVVTSDGEILIKGADF